MKSMLSAILAAALLAATHAYADAVASGIKGEVRAGDSAIVEGQRVFSGTTLVLGPGAQATLKFDDDMQIVLNENTTFRITDFRYKAQEPRGDRAVFDLLRGALRFVTGIVGARNRGTVALRAPQATIGIRGTDFMVAIVNPLYLSVITGSVASSNAAGAVVFGQGALGTVASSTVLATPVAASALPPAVGSTFSNLAAAKVAAGSAAGGSAGAAAGGAAAPTAGMGAVIAVGVGAAVLGTALNETSTTTHH